MDDSIFASYNQVTAPNEYSFQVPEDESIEVYNKRKVANEYLFGKQDDDEITFTDEYLTNPIISTQPIVKQDNTEVFKDQNHFLKTMNQTYKDVLKEKGLNPNYSKILTASAAFESGYGSKISGRFNYGGVKATKGSSKSTVDYVNGKYVRRNQTFRDFKSMKDYCSYVVDLLQNKRYNAFNQFSSDKPFDLWYHVLNAGYGGGDEKGKRNYINALKSIYKRI